MSTKQPVAGTNESLPTPPPTAPEQTFALTAADLQALIRTAVTAAVEAVQKNSSQDLTALGETIAQGLSKANHRKITIGEYMRRINAGRKHLERQAWQNDKLVPENVLSNEEIELLNQIHRTGRYVNRLIQVVIGMDGPDEVVYFRYHDRTADHRFALANAGVRDFASMVRMIVNEQKVEDDAEERENAKREALGLTPKKSRRTFGGSRATAEAEARAAEAQE